MEHMQIVNRSELPRSGTASRFEGYLFGEAPVSFFWVDTLPGEGPGLHTHPYAEVFVIHAGQANFVVDNEEQCVTSGQVVVVPPHTPHQFINSGEEPLRLLAIHTSGRIEQEWLEE
jgi:mannose-6-phosphate isomerase-like protein (cupin superfamily)